MMNTFLQPSWERLRMALCVVDLGSMTLAAQKLGVAQSTLGRQICELENELGIELFSRTVRGARLSDDAELLVTPLRTMQNSARKLQALALDASQRDPYPVRIACDEIIEAHILPNMLRELMILEPLVEITLVLDNPLISNGKDVADIFISFERPTENSTIVKKIGEIEFAFYATHEYLEERGYPDVLCDQMDHDIIQFYSSTQFSEYFKLAGLNTKLSQFSIQTTCWMSSWEMVMSGLGIGLGLVEVAKLMPNVRKVLHQTPEMHIPLWLFAHDGINVRTGMRKVFDRLASRLSIHKNL